MSGSSQSRRSGLSGRPDSREGRADEAPGPPATTANPYLPIAVGFYLLALPLVASAVFVASEPTGRIANGAGAVVFALLGTLLLLGRAR
jgi:hypothetical protein